MEMLRLSKLMADRGICSRREADSLIERGLVFVDGERVSVLGTKVSPDQVVTLDPAAKREIERAVTIIMNKPVGYVSGQPEKGYTAAVTLITPENRYKGDRSGIRFDRSHLRGLAPAGRLDIDSHGLLVFTQDGRIARRLIGEGSDIEKEYRVIYEGVLTDDALKLLNHGLTIDGRPLKRARVNREGDKGLIFILKEGKKRQIRRMCEMVGIRVTSLRRVRIGRIRLGDLTPGAWRYMGEDEVF